MHFEKPFPEQIARIIRLVAFDFDGVFTDNMVYVFENGSEAVREICDLFERELALKEE